jgi:hypothetical protein
MSEKLYDFPVDHDVSNLLVYWLPQTMLLSPEASQQAGVIAKRSISKGCTFYWEQNT